MRDEYVRNGAPADRTGVLPLFPTDVRPLPARDRGASRGAFHVAMIGRLTALKGGEELVDALALARGALPKPIALVVAGDGARRAAMEERARRAAVNARFAGELGAADRDAVLADADLLVVPSVWPEPFGLVGIEAATFGVPAVAFDVGGVRDWLRPGVSGELAPGDPPTPRGLADAIVRALRDPAHVARLSDGARAVAASFSAQRHVDDLEAILAAAAASPPP
jgi:glycosyltransferase involved in cell wall biosynthesis